MKLKELREIINAQPTNLDDLEVKIWLPGSLISLADIAPGQAKATYMFQHERTKGTVMALEGNVDEGSALESLNRRLTDSGTEAYKRDYRGSP